MSNRSQALAFSSFTSLQDPTPHFTERTWADFVGWLKAPLGSETPKEKLQLWAPAMFRGGRRKRDNVEYVSCLVLDVDVQPIPTASELRQTLAAYRAVAHTSASSTAEAPRWRVCIAFSRPVTAAEYGAVRFAALSRLSFPAGREASDPSRAWFVPRVGNDGSYELIECTGEPLSVEALLAEVPAIIAAGALAPVAPTVRGSNPDVSEADLEAAINLLAGAWPALGNGRHQAQRALAGGLVRDGWSEEHAVDFLCLVCGQAGDEQRAKRELTVRDTIARDEAGSPYDGWNRLAELIDPHAVSRARNLLSGEAAFSRLFENDPVFAKGATSVTSSAANDRAPESTPTHVPAPHANDTTPATPATAAPPAPRSPLKLSWGGWDAPVPPPTYAIDTFVPTNTIGLLVAKGSSLKTWLALSACGAVALGEPWLGRYPVTQGRALLVDYESGRDTIQERMHILGMQDARDFGIADFPSLRIDEPAFWVELTRTVIENDIRLVVVDSFAAGAFGTDENDRRITTPLDLAGRLVVSTNCSLIFIHHAKKGGEGGDERDLVRGSGAIYGAADWVYTMIPADEDRTRMTVRNIKAYRKKPEDIRVALTDKGLHLDGTPEAKAEEREEDLESKIKHLLMRGPVLNQDILRDLLRVDVRAMRAALKALTEKGEVFKETGVGYQLDSEESRLRRIRYAIGSPVKSASALAGVACVRDIDIEELMRPPGNRKLWATLPEQLFLDGGRFTLTGG